MTEKEALKQLSKAKAVFLKDNDRAEFHGRCDDILLEFLESLGYAAVAKRFKRLRGDYEQPGNTVYFWYS